MVFILISESDPDKAESILSEIRSTFEKSGFWFKNESQVFIVPSSDEAVLTWTSINYQLGTFKLVSYIIQTNGLNRFLLVKNIMTLTNNEKS